MKKEKKSQIVDKIQASLEKSSFGIVTEYRGMNTADLLELRKRLKQSESKYEIMKNSLVTRAAKGAGIENVATFFKGPVALAYTSADPVTLSRSISDYIRATKTTMVVKGGFLNGKVISAQDVTALSLLPSRTVLLGMILGTIQAPITRVVSQLNAPIQNLVGVLQARANQLGG